VLTVFEALLFILYLKSYHSFSKASSFCKLPLNFYSNNLVSSSELIISLTFDSYLVLLFSLLLLLLAKFPSLVMLLSSFLVSFLCNRSSYKLLNDFSERVSDNDWWCEWLVLIVSFYSNCCDCLWLNLIYCRV
jgi:hypothetical protein